MRLRRPGGRVGYRASTVRTGGGGRSGSGGLGGGRARSTPRVRRHIKLIDKPSGRPLDWSGERLLQLLEAGRDERPPLSGIRARERRLADHEIDLWDYVEHPALTPLKFQQGASTVCAVAAPNGQAIGMKSHKRKVVAVGQLAPPLAVYLKA